MNRLLNISLVFLLMVSTAGVTISKHYCGDMLMNTAIMEEADSCCPEGDHEDNCGGCENETDVFQIKDEFQGLQVNPDLAPELTAVLDIEWSDNLLNEALIALSNPYPVDHSPPAYSNPLFIQHCSYLI